MAHDVLESLTPTLLSPTYDDQAERSPDMTVRDKVNDLRHKAQVVDNESEHFVNFGFSVEEVKKPLTDAADALESAYILHQSFLSVITDAESVMKEYGPKIEAMRNEILARLTYISKQPGHEDIQKNVATISLNDDISDTIMDLGTCYEVALLKAEPLNERNYSMERIEELGEVFKKVSQAYPVAKAGEGDERDAMLLKNRAFWHAVEQERILREDILPMVFWDDYSWRSRYVSPSRDKRRS